MISPDIGKDILARFGPNGMMGRRELFRSGALLGASFGTLQFLTACQKPLGLEAAVEAEATADPTTEIYTKVLGETEVAFEVDKDMPEEFVNDMWRVVDWFSNNYGDPLTSKVRVEFQAGQLQKGSVGINEKGVPLVTLIGFAGDDKIGNLRVLANELSSALYSPLNEWLRFDLREVGGVEGRERLSQHLYIEGMSSVDDLLVTMSLLVEDGWEPEAALEAVKENSWGLELMPHQEVFDYFPPGLLLLYTILHRVSDDVQVVLNNVWEKAAFTAGAVMVSDEEVFTPAWAEEALVTRMTIQEMLSSDRKRGYYELFEEINQYRVIAAVERYPYLEPSVGRIDPEEQVRPLVTRRSDGEGGYDLLMLLLKGGVDELDPTRLPLVNFEEIAVKQGEVIYTLGAGFVYEDDQGDYYQASAMSIRHNEMVNLPVPENFSGRLHELQLGWLKVDLAEIDAVRTNEVLRQAIDQYSPGELVFLIIFMAAEGIAVPELDEEAPFEDLPDIVGFPLQVPEP